MRLAGVQARYGVRGGWENAHPRFGLGLGRSLRLTGMRIDVVQLDRYNRWVWIAV